MVKSDSSTESIKADKKSNSILLPRLSRAEQKNRSYERHIDYFLMGIISAYTHHDETMSDERRLRDAREALFGKKPPSGRPEINDDIPLWHILLESDKPYFDKMRQVFLKHSTSEANRRELLAEIERKQDSVRGSVRKQSVNIKQDNNRVEQSVVDRVRRKAMKPDLTNQDLIDIGGLIDGDTHRARVMIALFKGLKQLGIEINSLLVKNPTD